ncbi:hypothetical protein GH721_10420 [Kriegella sp. EG-1]|nr:hypothetical protein [Flavobacteriaceae bacterium EG-1]
MKKCVFMLFVFLLVLIISIFSEKKIILVAEDVIVVNDTNERLNGNE